MRRGIQAPGTSGTSACARSVWCGYTSSSFRWDGEPRIAPDDVKRSALHLFKRSAHVFAEDTHCGELASAQEEESAQDCDPASGLPLPHTQTYEGGDSRCQADRGDQGADNGKGAQGIETKACQSLECKAKVAEEGVFRPPGPSGWGCELDSRLRKADPRNHTSKEPLSLRHRFENVQRRPGHQPEIRVSRLDPHGG